MTAKTMQHVAPAHAATASPLLRFLAGDFAEAIARVWRPPHTEFFALPGARRHAAAIILAGLAKNDAGPGELRRLLEFARDAAVAEFVAGSLASGFMRALSKAGETLWPREDYAVFLSLLADPMASEVLRHMDLVRPAAFAPLAALPVPLRVAPVVRVLTSREAAEDLAQAFSLAVRMRHPDSTARLARRWGAGGEARALFTRAMEDLTPDAFRPPQPAPKLPEPFIRITTRKDLEHAALEFRNCLGEHATRIAEGRMAVFVWRGAVSAAVAINQDPAGWRLAEAKGVDNNDLDEPLLREFVRLVEAQGVRTGPSVQSLLSRLGDHVAGCQIYRPGPGWVEQLALGDLWS